MGVLCEIEVIAELNEPEPEEEAGPISFTLTPLQDQDDTNIRIERKQDGSLTTVYSNTHSRDEGDVSVTVEGKSGAKFDIYYNDIYQTSIIKD